MQRKDMKIRSSTGDGEFDCYIVTPDGGGKVPAMVLASAIHGVDEDMRSIADEFASHGFVVAAPDLFWRSVPGPLGRDDKRTTGRGQPRLAKIKANETDMTDTLNEVRKLAQFNGRAATMGFCYGGPFAILGPKRLGYDGGVSCHGTQMGDYLGELEGMSKPVCVIWGDQDHAAPPEVQEAYRKAATHHKHLDLHIFPGVLHGYMMKGNPQAFSRETYEFSMKKALAILEGLRTEPLRKAS